MGEEYFDAQQILPGLWLGSREAAKRYNALKKRNITHILTVASDLDPPYKYDFIYLIIKAYDHASQNLLTWLPDAISFINEGRRSGGVLVHCYAGISRSSTLVLAYLIHSLRISLSEALNIARNARPSVCPNAGFLEQLHFWNILCSLQVDQKIVVPDLNEGISISDEQHEIHYSNRFYECGGSCLNQPGESVEDLIVEEGVSLSCCNKSLIREWGDSKYKFQCEAERWEVGEKTSVRSVVEETLDGATNTNTITITNTQDNNNNNNDSNNHIFVLPNPEKTHSAPTHSHNTLPLTCVCGASISTLLVSIDLTLHNTPLHTFTPSEIKSDFSNNSSNSTNNSTNTTPSHSHSAKTTLTLRHSPSFHCTGAINSCSCIISDDSCITNAVPVLV